MSNRQFRGIRTLRFNNFELDVRASELRRDGSRVRLQEQPLRILTALLERPGEVVTREEIRKRLWPNGTVVEVSHGINAAVQRLREALGESAENPRYVETLARRGYRFIASVEIAERTPSGSGGESEASPPEKISHFRVLERLGAGGMGVVYRAEDGMLGRSVALKFLPDLLARDPAALARFRREAQAASALNHPNICTIYGVEECEGKPVIVMEYIEGESLEAALRRGPLPLDRALSCAVQIADALEAAHRAGIVHRDLKPANILVTAAGVKVLDFGLAKMERPPALGFEPAHLTNEGAILGTLHYLSPEQAQGQPAEPRSDIFSFGVVLHEMLTGRRAFDGPNAARVMAAILALDPAPIDPAAPAGLQEVVSRCLAKEPEQRWQSAGQLKSALEVVSVAPVQPAAPLRPGLVRRFRYWGATAALVLLLAAGSAAYLPLQRMSGQGGSHTPARVNPFSLLAGKGPRIPPVNPPPDPVSPRAMPHSDAATDGRAGGADGATRRAPKFEPRLRTSVLNLEGGPITRVALSPDSKRLAYIAGGRLWVVGTKGGKAVDYGRAMGTPFWSPDGRSVAAVGMNHDLLRFDLGAGAPVKICDVDTTFSGAWSRDGTIVIGLIHDGLYRVPARGGVLTRMTALDPARGETRHIALQFLPDGRRFLYLAASNQAGRSFLYAGRLDSADRTEIMPLSGSAQCANGFLIYLAGTLLTASPFNWRNMKVSGEPIILGGSPPSDPAANASVKLVRFSAAGDVVALAPSMPSDAQVTLIQHWAPSN